MRLVTTTEAALSFADTFGQHALEPGADLTNADLSGADLSSATLLGSNLPQANLFDTNLFDTNLSNANLGNASLHGVDPRYADLTDADLTAAYLTGADLTGAKLAGARLKYAHLTNATFGLGTYLPDGQTVAQHGFDAAGLQAYLVADPVSAWEADNLTIIPEPTTLLLALLALTAVPLRVRCG